MRLACSLALLSATGCYQTEVPLRRNEIPAQAASMKGPAAVAYPAAEYQIQSRSADLARARVWSQTYVDQLGRQPGGVVHVGLQIDSKSPRELVLNIPQIDVLDTHRGHADNLVPSRIVGDRVIPAGQPQRADFYFELPQALSPQDVAAIRVRWGLDDQGRVISQSTPFTQYRGPNNTLGAAVVGQPLVYLPSHDSYAAGPPPRPFQIANNPARERVVF